MKFTVVSMCLFFTVGLLAQSAKTDEKSMITMTEGELSSLLATIAEARRTQLQERDEEQSQRYLDDLRKKQKESSGARSAFLNPDQNVHILRELRYLNQRIDDLDNYGTTASSTGKDNSTYILPGSSNSTPSYPSNQGSKMMIIPSNKRKIKALQNEIDSLKKLELNNISDFQENHIMDSLRVFNDKFGTVRRQLDSLERKMMFKVTLDTAKAISPNRSYFKQKVLFANNSAELDSLYTRDIEDLFGILNEYPESKVLLEGWASPLGKVSYNKQLSMRRAESVEKAFLQKGISSDRIFVSFRGEDKSSTEQQARRVDMSIIVR